ncbi:alpha/beta fold hydrolase [Nannocystaceae bacterium ST9]
MSETSPARVRKLWLAREDGARVYVRVLGPRESNERPNEPALLILDGIGCSGWAFRRIIPRIAKQRRVVFMHYRGHGRSPTPPRPWHLGMHTLADDAAAACTAVGVDRVVALGFSMGFQVALEFYRRHHERTVGLISLAGPPGQPLSSFRGTDTFAFALPFLVAATSVAKQLTTRVWRSILPSRQALDLGLRFEVNRAKIDSRDFELYLRGMADISPELFVAMLEQAHRHCADDLLPRIRVPTLVIAGARDEFVPLPRLREMAFAIPGARWEVFDEATHALPAEYPEDIGERIASFFDEIAGATA